MEPPGKRGIDGAANVKPRQGLEGIVLRRVAIVSDSAPQADVGIGDKAPPEGFEVEGRARFGRELCAAHLPRSTIIIKRREPVQEFLSVGRRTTIIFIRSDGDTGHAVGIFRTSPHQIQRMEQVVERLRERIGTDPEGAETHPDRIGIEPLARNPHGETPFELRQQLGKPLRCTRIG